ncbi:hypothetical protein IU459_11765 [Nocardia amamiensis]|uniref:DUF1360 domain-containing protein n=1 Tax=Nocardia amamiensis TaxID=404578 RepID=A0ABS0CQY9_9NOCA|nr:hypothetical protein [Nocardia amamiensis]MBF6298217.1 hypothetical protein [Nocardia amamiensis]
MTFPVFLLALGATARLTRLITDDYIARHLRVLVIKRTGHDSELSYMMTCPWCLSPWLGAIVVTLSEVAHYHGWDEWFLLPAAVLSVSWLVGTGAEWLGGPVQQQPDPSKAEQ